MQPRGLDRVLAWNPAWPGNRIGLAKWLFDPANPLTADEVEAKAKASRTALYEVTRERSRP